ncbi:MAG TPA: cupin domain-containing protein [Gemmatimonadales bacterium]
MSHHVLATAVALAIALPLGATGAQDTTMAMAADTMVTMRAGAVQWGPVETPGFAPGLEIGVVSGNPGQAGPYTIRLRFPSGYAFPPHWHPTTENLTVLSGRFLLGMGERSDDDALEEYTPGDYLMIPAKMPHFGRVEGETVIQLHGTGPFEIKLVEQSP